MKILQCHPIMEKIVVFINDFKQSLDILMQIKHEDEVMARKTDAFENKINKHIVDVQCENLV